jgi:hypothetical protein
MVSNKITGLRRPDCRLRHQQPSSLSPSAQSWPQWHNIAKASYRKVQVRIKLEMSICISSTPYIPNMSWSRDRTKRHHARSDPYRRSLRSSRLRPSSCHHLPLRTPSTLRPRISCGAGGDSGRRASSSNTFPASNTTSPYSNNIVLSDFVHNSKRPGSLWPCQALCVPLADGTR